MNNTVEFLLMLGVIMMISYLANRMDSSLRRKMSVNGTPEPCPPHKWETLDQPGVAGVVFMRCTKCHLLPQEVT